MVFGEDQSTASEEGERGMNRITERAARAEWNIKCGKHPSPRTLLADIMIRDAIRRPGRRMRGDRKTREAEEWTKS